MRINIVILLMFLGALLVVSGQNVRQKRGIGSWISGMFSRFKKSPKKPVFHIYQPYGDYDDVHSHSFGPAPKPHSNHPYAPHYPHYLQSSGHGLSTYSNYGDHGSHGSSGSGGQGGYGHHKGIPYGFGPIKESDVLGDLHSSGSYVPEAPHIVPDSYGVPQSHSNYEAPLNLYAPSSGHGSIVVDYSAPKVPNDPFSHPVKSLHVPTFFSESFSKDQQGKGSFVPPAPFQDNFVEIDSIDFESDSGVHGYVPTFPHKDTIDHDKKEGKSAPVGVHGGGFSFDDNDIDSFLSAPPSDSFKEPSTISVTNEAYKPPGNGAVLPLSPHSNFEKGFSQSQSFKGGNSLNLHSDNEYILDQFASGAINGVPLSYFPKLGPNDPIIEIIFQEGDPLPAPPAPRIDPKLFLPAQDDVEVYFIEYASEDEIKNVKDIDVKNARPAILENFPAEVPYDLRNQLLNSGILENAQIEIINLENGAYDQSLDSRTRNALVNAYNRRQRQAPRLNEIDSNKQTVDVRVKKLFSDTNTPEGVAEFISGLKDFRKGTYAGVVEVNDTDSKLLPVRINGNHFPLPDNIQLKDKKLNGVLVLAQDEGIESFAQNSRQPKDLKISGSYLSKRINSPTSFQLETKHHDNAGWIPIPNS